MIGRGATLGIAALVACLFVADFFLRIHVPRQLEVAGASADAEVGLPSAPPWRRLETMVGNAVPAPVEVPAEAVEPANDDPIGNDPRRARLGSHSFRLYGMFMRTEPFAVVGVFDHDGEDGEVLHVLSSGDRLGELTARSLDGFEISLSDGREWVTLEMFERDQGQENE